MPPRIRFLLDENVPTASVGELLRDRGHEVQMVGEAFPKASPDALLLAASEIEGFVVVTFDNDFRRLIEQIPTGSKTRFNRQAGRLSLRMDAPQVVARLRDTIDIIEFQYERSQARGQRFIMQLSLTSILMSEQAPE